LLIGGSRAALPRHQGVARDDRLEPHLLTRAEQVLFRRVAVFAGDGRSMRSRPYAPESAPSSGRSSTSYRAWSTSRWFLQRTVPAICAIASW
jgi:hypothetical protein